MKRILLLAIICFSTFIARSQNITILPAPDKSLNVSLFEALQNRHSEREFSDKEIDNSTLSQVLWAAAGVNRPDGKLTVPSSNNVQDINIYVCKKDGAYLYKAAEHSLVKVSEKDLRNDIAGSQTTVAEAPIILVLTSDLNKIRTHSALIGNLDAGYVSQNICLICSALGLNTVPRVQMNKDVLTKELKLKEDEILVVNNPIGYPIR